MLRGWRLPLMLLLIGSIGYMAVSRLTFAAPVTHTENNDCGFIPGDFTAAGQLRFSDNQAWWISFLRQQEYCSALSLGLVVAFVGFAVGHVRQLGRRAMSGAVAGGGILAVLTLCLSCLAPTLSAIGLGLLSQLALPLAMPKWLMLLNTVLLTTWGVGFLSRRARACPVQYASPGGDVPPTHTTVPGAATRLQKLSTTGLGMLVLLLLLPTVLWAEDWATILTPARPGFPLANPVTLEEVPPPPLSLLRERPVNPIYVPGLPGLPQGKLVTDDYGNKKPKYDGVLIRQSRVEGGKVVIPAGGLVYLEDTWRGEVALVGEPLAYLGKEPIYIDYDMSIVVKKEVTIPAGESVVIGGQVYHYYATVGHGKMANHTLHVRTIAGTDWEWAFGHPVLSTTETNWWGGTRFAQLYNQGQAREVTPKHLVFDWITGVRTDRMLMANKKEFAGWARPGQEWRVGERTLQLVSLDEQTGTARVQVREGNRVVLDKTLGPVQSDLLIEDTGARQALVFEYGDMAGFLVPWPKAFDAGKA
ncbi:MAG TPA: hypothetical protein VIH59_21195, partial [Candidatus Tectomicrobia bacterium]